MTGSGRRYPIFLLFVSFVLQPFPALPESGGAGAAPILDTCKAANTFLAVTDGQDATSAVADIAAGMAEREGYPAIAAYLARRAALQLAADPAPWQPAGLPAPLLAQGRRLATRIAARRQETEKAARAGAAPGTDPGAAVVARSLGAPRFAPFAEHPLPAGLSPVEPTAAQKAAGQALLATARRLPGEPELVRAERQGLRAAALVLSPDYDPGTEISSGGYWVLLSEDGGRTWSAPLYTGLRIHTPYVVRAASALPLFAGDHLQVEVEVRELDPASISFPPVREIRVKRQARGLYLDLRLADLTRDTDGDGLTDLAEERLLTDPRRPDSDGDGIPDGRDPLPLVPWRAGQPAMPLSALLAIGAVG
ncbi:MAG TPA: hypothetical protein VFE33_29715, partial [Thermoanaerobaculia bacterium]|nr:hypothetical protein [Thermoanaerobaculia bacterium]